ncbi:Putative membrane protein [Corynebacterium glutamicum]|uniref:MFS transporter n=1 Tax=Corynebacterium glutamicum TaxID=1718 RepID=UPI00097F3C71|nr:MFS transporter [Corynebacterium glutamicum]SJM44520.1 Putative membrane protein [Corynebacterium glutamicum]
MTNPTEERNARRLIWANGLQNIGDQIVAAKTVLPWLLQAAGAPGFLLALLVPIREAGSMLPQAAITGWVLRQTSRSKVWVIGSNGQFVSALGIGVAALFLRGWALGITVIVLLAALSLFRSMCSIASKDVQGKVISKGKRGLVTGRATVIGGVIGLVAGLAIAIFLGSDSPTWVLASVVIASSFSWLFASMIFARLERDEPETSHDAPSDNPWGRRCIAALKDDKAFRRFVLVRSMMLVTALSTAFIVALAAESGNSIDTLGFFLIASGLASMVGGRVSGIWSDRSSKNVMAGGALFGSIVLILVVLSSAFAPAQINTLVFPLSFFLIALAHTAIRVARKTYVMDMAEGDLRTRYVADANTLMGVVLLIVGALSGFIAIFGNEAALLFLAAIGLLGTISARGLKEVSAG